MKKKDLVDRLKAKYNELRKKRKAIPEFIDDDDAMAVEETQSNFW